MKLLIISATKMEVAPMQFSSKMDGNGKERILISGVGIGATAYTLTKHLQHHKYDFILQVGVGGSYDPNLKPGDVVFISSDQFGDLGAEDHEKYLDIFDMELMDQDTHPFSGKALKTPILAIHQKIKLPRVKGLTVNTVSGNQSTIKLRTDKYGCDVESMEGAAFHYVCMQEGIPFAQVRAISNYVTPRDRSKWKMPEAINSLNKWLAEFLINRD